MTRRFKPALAALCLLAASSALAAQEYKIKVVASGLARPTGIAIDDDTLYFTEVPSPGKAGSANAIKKLNLETGAIDTLHMGEPEPVNIAIGRDGTIYWVCKSAGVILEQDEKGMTRPLLTGLQKPSGIAINRRGVVYYTQVPTPGVAGSAGGMNGVFSFADGWEKKVIHTGEPEPVDIAVAPNGDLYWTCRTAGVILVRRAKDGKISPFLTGLKKPTGITIDRQGRNLYYTEVPTPGISGAKGGMNRVVRYDLRRQKMSVIHMGDPEPTDIAVGGDGDVYWTCSSAGVIVEASLVRWDD